jgi:hypothetical protein
MPPESWCGYASIRRFLAGSRLRDAAMDANRFDDLVADPVEGMQAGHRVLEDHRDLGTHELLHVLLRHADQLLAVEPDLTRYLRRLPVDQAHDRLGGHALA